MTEASDRKSLKNIGNTFIWRYLALFAKMSFFFSQTTFINVMTDVGLINE